MKKTFSCVVILALILTGQQGFGQKGIKAMVNAEKQFAAFTESHTVKEGFLNNLDSAGVIFGRNGSPQNGLAAYAKFPSLPAILSWEPEFAVMNTSGDFGFTTGPYTLRLPSPKDSLIDRGNYTTLWHINNHGEWKFLCDLGASYPANAVHPPVKRIKQLVLTQRHYQLVNYDETLAMDKQLNKEIVQSKGQALAAFIDDDSWLNIAGQLPVAGKQRIITALDSLPAGLQFETLGGGLSPAGDMAYMYGKVTFGKKANNYLRVWARKDNQWIILLHVINW